MGIAMSDSPSYKRASYNDFTTTRWRAVEQMASRVDYPKTVRYLHTIIHSALEQALKEHLIMINPAKAVSLPSLKQKQMHPLDTTGVQQSLTVTKNDRYYTAYLLTLTTDRRTVAFGRSLSR